MIYGVKSQMYRPNQEHRNNNPNKSQWRIPIDAEVETFDYTYQQNWIDKNEGWGLHIVNKNPKNLGVSKDLSRRLFIAKFVSANMTGVWHGYPADYRCNTQDIPNRNVLRNWGDRLLFSRAKIRKILKGQPCNL